MTIMIHKYYPPPKGQYQPGLPADQQPLSNEAKAMLGALPVFLFDFDFSLSLFCLLVCGCLFVCFLLVGA
jgi:hypothetical protein